MKRFALFAALVALVALPAWGQTLKVPAPGKSEQTAQQKAEKLPSAQNIKPEPKHLTSRSRLDARECLQYKTNLEIIACAEKFL